MIMSYMQSKAPIFTNYYRVTVTEMKSKRKRNKFDSYEKNPYTNRMFIQSKATTQRRHKIDRTVSWNDCSQPNYVINLVYRQKLPTLRNSCVIKETYINSKNLQINLLI